MLPVGQKVAVAVLYEVATKGWPTPACMQVAHAQ